MKVPPIKPMASVSPSRFVNLQSCILKEAFAASRAEPLLPKSPKAALGTVCHKLLELAAKKAISSDRESILKKWGELIHEAEQRLSTSKLEKHLSPLSKSCNEFFVVRERAIKLTSVLAERFTPRAEGKGIEGLGYEVDVTTPDGLLKGRIDCVDQSDGVLTIKDYKTGTVFESEGESTAVRPEYVTQLKLYAAMYAEVFSKWPAKLFLVSMSGEFVPVQMIPDECRALAREARERLQAANEKIEAVLSGRKILSDLASPLPANCRFCTYRPACAAYRNARTSQPELQWPNDFWGTLVEISISPIGRRTILVRNDNAAGRTTVVRRLADDVRYFALKKIPLGTTIALFSLRKDNAPDTFTEGPMTAIYKASDLV